VSRRTTKKILIFPRFTVKMARAPQGSEDHTKQQQNSKRTIEQQLLGPSQQGSIPSERTTEVSERDTSLVCRPPALASASLIFPSSCSFAALARTLGTV